MIGIIAKLTVLFAMLIAINGMDGVISTNFEGYSPDSKTVRINGLGDYVHATPEAKVSVGEARMVRNDEDSPIENDLVSSFDNVASGKSESLPNKNDKIDVYNAKSGKPVGEVSGKAAENADPLVPCGEPLTGCASDSEENAPQITPIPTKKPQPTVVPDPIPSPIIGPIPIPVPSVYPCDPPWIPYEVNGVGLPCLDQI